MTTSSTARQPKGIPVGGQFAATGHSEPGISLAPSPTAPKESSRGRTTSVTLPNGKVATRTSKTKTYTHAVVQSAEDPELVILDREDQIRDSQVKIAALEEALEDPKFKKRRRFPSDTDPDVDYQGRSVYYGFEYYLVAADGKTILGETRGNSKGDPQGMYDVETGDFDVKKVGRAIPFLKDQARINIREHGEAITQCEADITAVKAGTYDLGHPGVINWSSRADLAQKAANQYVRRTRHTHVAEVDQ